MPPYPLTIYVTLEQESAIKDFFTVQGWQFIKKENGISEYGEKQAENFSIASETHFTNNVRQTVPVTHIPVKPDTSPSVPGMSNDLKRGRDEGNPNCSSDNVNDDGTDDGDGGTDVTDFGTGNVQVAGSRVHVTATLMAESGPQGIGTELSLNTHRATPDASTMVQSDESGLVSSEAEKEQASERNWSEKTGIGKSKKDLESALEEDNLEPNNLKLLIDEAVKALEVIDGKAHTDSENAEKLQKQEETNVAPSEGDQGNQTAKKPVKRYKKRKGKYGTYYCAECNNTFAYESRFKDHKIDGKCRFECPHCGKIFLRRMHKNFLAHLKFHSGEKEYPCDFCDKSYYSSYKLKVHRRTHTGEKPFICEHCSDRFHSVTLLNSHKRNVHSGDARNFVCQICGGRFKTRTGVTNHMNITHSSVKPFECDMCDFSTKYKRKLMDHRATHSVNRQLHQCPECPKKVLSPITLQQHIKRCHEKILRYFCDECNKGFYDRKALSYHKNTHTGDKPYKCPKCEYRVAFKGNLCKHMKIHEDEKPAVPVVDERLMEELMVQAGFNSVNNSIMNEAGGRHLIKNEIGGINPSFMNEVGGRNPSIMNEVGGRNPPVMNEVGAFNYE